MRPLLLALALTLTAGCGSDDDLAAVGPDDAVTAGDFDDGVADDPITPSDLASDPLGDDSEEGGFTIDYAAMAVDGAWQSVDDPNVAVSFAPGTFTETYEGEVMLTGPITFTETCDGSDGGGDLDTFSFTVTPAGDDPFCYNVVETDGETLAYTMAGGRGNTLRFRRAD